MTSMHVSSIEVKWCHRVLHETEARLSTRGMEVETDDFKHFEASCRRTLRSLPN